MCVSPNFRVSPRVILWNILWLLNEWDGGSPIVIGLCWVLGLLTTNRRGPRGVSGAVLEGTGETEYFAAVALSTRVVPIKHLATRFVLPA